MATDDELVALGLKPPRVCALIPGGPQTVVELIETAARDAPEAEALIGREQRYTYAELARATAAAAGALAARGIRPGDRVGASAPNHPDLVLAFLATQWLGAIWVGVNRALAAPEKQALLADCGASMLLADPETLAALQTDLPKVVIAGDNDWIGSASPAPSAEVDPWAPAAIAYTSGTTGFPKGATHSQHNLLTLAVAARWHGRDGQWQSGLRRGVALPLTVVNLMAIGPIVAFVNRAACVCMDRMDAPGIADWVARERIETFAGAPTTIHDLLTRPEIDPADLATLVVPTAGGGHVSDALQALYRKRFGVPLGIGYGLTEAMASVAEIDLAGPIVPGACGRAYAHLSLTIRNSEGRAMPPDSEGEIWISPIAEGPWAQVWTPMLGYWRQPHATAEALAGGALRTGDLGRLDPEGNLFVTGRKNDLIIRGGANIYPAEIERVLLEDARVDAAGVVGAPDERLGETVVAFIQSAEPAQPLVDDLARSCVEALAGYKQPQRWIVQAKLPRNAMGKVDKRALRAQLTGAVPDANAA